MSTEDIVMDDSSVAPATKLDKGKGRDALSTLALDVSGFALILLLYRPR